MSDQRTPVRVTIHYRWHEGARFDAPDYHGRHMRLALELLEPYELLRLESSRPDPRRPLAAGDPIASTQAYFPSMDAAKAALAGAGPALLADVPCYSDIKPELHLAEVLQHFPHAS